MVVTQFDANVRILRTDDGIEYINKEFAIYLLEEEIFHQINCQGPPPQNGVVERKNLLFECCGFQELHVVVQKLS